MSKRFRVHTYWPGRTDGVPALAAQIGAFFAAIGELSPKLRGFLFQAKGAAPVTPARFEEPLRQSAVHWMTGDTERESYAPRFFLERRNEPPVEVTITCGIEPLGVGPVWTPNRLELAMRADVGDERASRAVIEGILRAAVASFHPDFGFAGSERIPDAPMPVFSDGKPPVGWMTYLRDGYPPLPHALPAPTVAYPIAGEGTLVVAHPELFHEGDEAQRAAVDRLRELLRAAGVLVPAAELPERR